MKIPEDIISTDFNPVDWIQQMINDQDKISVLNECIFSLEQYQENCNSAIQQHVEQTIKGISRLENEVEILKNQVAKFPKLEEQPQKNDLFVRLGELDLILTRMEDVRICLKDADSWNTFGVEMDAILIAQDYEKAAKRLKEAKKSLSLITSSPYYKERSDLLANVTEQFLKIIGKSLATALQENNFELLKRLSNYYKMIGHDQTFLSTYCQSIMVDFETKSLSESFKFVIETIETQKQVKRLYFPESDVVAQVTEKLMDPILLKIKKTTENIANKNLPEVIDLYAKAIEFGHQIDADHEIEALFEPLKSNYEQLESKYFESKMLELMNVQLGDDALLAIAKEALERCEKFCSSKQPMILNCLDKFYADLIIKMKEQRRILPPTIEKSDYILGLNQSDWKYFEEKTMEYKNLVAFYENLDAFRNSSLEKALKETKSYCLDFQENLINFLVSPIKYQLEHYKDFDWTKKESSSLPQFSQSPLPCITAIGEYLLTLPQNIDSILVDSELKKFGLELPNLKPADLESFSALQLDEIALLYITSVARTIEGELFKTITNLTISESGRKQINADTSYFYNVLSALDIEPMADMVTLMRYLEMKPQQFAQEAPNDNVHVLVTKMLKE